MKNYLFILTKDKNEIHKISEDDFRFNVYNDFLEKFYFTNIEDNEDFIPYPVGDKVTMILKLNEMTEDLQYWVFDTMQDYLFKV